MDKKTKRLVAASAILEGVFLLTLLADVWADSDGFSTELFVAKWLSAIFACICSAAIMKREGGKYKGNVILLITANAMLLIMHI